jgi:hypothetical protein
MPVQTNWLIVAILGLAALFETSHASAAGLVQVYETALANDPAYQVTRVKQLMKLISLAREMISMAV